MLHVHCIGSLVSIGNNLVYGFTLSVYRIGSLYSLTA
jgi:hypothetical protein